MKKLSLHLDDLAVETFEPVAPRRDARGTVLGNADTASCPGVSCAPTCGIAISPPERGGAAPISFYHNCCV
jgi:hypothetical protein